MSLIRHLCVALAGVSWLAACDLPTIEAGSQPIDAVFDADFEIAFDGDLPTPSLVVDCVDATEDVFALPAALPLFDAGERGSVVRCAPGETKTLEELSATLAEVGDLTVQTGYAMYMLGYRTERDPGEEGFGTARLYLPDQALEGPLPVIVVAHGTVGLADACAPSIQPGPEDASLVLPWVARGFPVVAPDYAGLGTAGVHGYANNPDGAHSVLDAARAALFAVARGALDGRVVLVGHSQGGGAALAGFALAPTYGKPHLEIVATVAMAPYMTTENMAEAVQYAPSVEFDDGGMRAAFAMMLYADFANLFGEGNGGDVFAPTVRDYVTEAVKTQCIFDLVPTLDSRGGSYLPPARLSDMIDLRFQIGVTSCMRDVIGCTDHHQAYVDRCRANLLDFTPGAPVLFLSGDADRTVPLEKQACVRDVLADDDVHPQVCVLSGADHTSIIGARAGFAVEWVEAVLADGELPACPDGPDLPACVPYSSE